MARQNGTANGFEDGYGHRGNGWTAVQAVMGNRKILKRIAWILYGDTLLSGREARQAYFRRLSLVSRAWNETAVALLYSNPFFGTATRADQFQESIRVNPHFGKLVTKLIFGEGSDTDIQDWHSLYTVPTILELCPNVVIVGFDGLHNVHLDTFKAALISRTHLEEIRACDLMPDPWTTMSFFFDEIVLACPKVTRLRLYAMLSGEHASKAAAQIGRLDTIPKPLNRPFTHLSLNSCLVDYHNLRNILGGSHQSMQRLYLEYPTHMTDNDLLSIVRDVAGGLQEFVVEGFLDNVAVQHTRKIMANEILRMCRNLRVLDFREAVADIGVFDYFYGSKLRLWTFECNNTIKPAHWISAFKHPHFPKGGRCRVLTPGWSATDVRSVRIAAWAIGLTWHVSGETLREFEDY